MTVSKNFVVRNGLEVGGDTLFANSVNDRVGIGTTNPTSTLTVKGNTALETLNISGVSTFNSNAIFNSSIGIGTTNPTSALTVAGNVLVVGVSTFKNTVEVATGKSISFGDAGVGDLKLYTDGSNSYINQKNTDKLIIDAGGNFRTLEITDLQESLTMAKFTGHGGSVELYYNNSKKIETSGLGVTVTGVTSTTYLYATGISTFITGPVFIGSGTTTGTVDQKLQVTGGGYFSGSVGIGITTPTSALTVVGSGTSTSQLYVVGFSTFVGYSTFRDYVNIEDGLYVSGVSTFVGYSTFRDYVNIEDGLNVSGVSTFVGYSTFRDYVNIEYGLNVSGISTFVGYSTFQDYVYIQDGLNVSGVSTFVGYSTFRDYVNIEYGLNVSGISTFVGYSTFRDYVNIEDGLNVSGISTFVGFSTFQDYVYIQDGLNVSGVSTFNDQVDIYSNVSIQGSVGINTTIYDSIFVIASAGESSSELMCLDGPNSSNRYGLFSQYANETTITSRDGNSYGTIKLNQYDGSTVQTSITIPPSGNVGVGSTLPSSKLTVDGNVNVSGIVTAPTFVGNLTGTATTASTVDILNTNGLTTVYYPTFVESRTDGQIVRADVDLTYRTDDNILTVPNINLSSSGLTVGTGGTVITTTSGGSVGLGTISPVSKLSVVGGDASVGINTSQGIILTSANGTRYRLFVENDGTIKTVAV